METIAAIDLGSHSFHLIVARLEDGQPRVVDRMRERVRLAAGLDERKRLEPEAMDRAVACLERFGERLRPFNGTNVRVVGTNTLRRAKNSAKFLERASEALGHRIEIVSGVEEARLVYLGVAHTTEVPPGRRLVIDIGGGSTECILGEGFEMARGESLPIGCVRFAREFFPEGKISEKRFEACTIAAEREVAAIAADFREHSWKTAIGTSGTIRAVRDVLVAQGWSGDADHADGVPAAGLSKLVKHVVGAGHVEKLSLEGLSDERALVFPAGVAILQAVVRRLRIEHLEIGRGALREGLLFDLLGRKGHEDVRDRTVEQLQSRYRVDILQAQRVRDTSIDLLERVAKAWSIPRQFQRQYLGWAALLHEMGLSVSHSSFHHHGAYLATYGDLPGFTFEGQRLLAALIGGHRRKVRSETFEGLRIVTPREALLLCVILRIAVRLHRSRSAIALPAIDARADGSKLTLLIDAEWVKDNPLTRADLEAEARRLAQADIELTLAEA